MKDYWSIMTHSTQILGCSVLMGMVMGVSGCATMQPQAIEPNTGYGVPATERTLAQRILDSSIRNTALQNINSIDPTLHQRSRIGVDSFYSHVLLTGEVPDTTTKQTILRIVGSMPDVKKVHDGLNVAPNKGVSYTVHDGYLTSKINAKILSNEAIKTSQVKVVTDDGIVYVLGKLTPTQRGHLMHLVDSTVGVKKLVLLTELIDDDGASLDESSVTQESGLEPPVYNAAGQEVYPNPAPNIPVYTVPNAYNTPKTAATAQPNPHDVDGVQETSAYIELYKHEVPGW